MSSRSGSRVALDSSATHLLHRVAQCATDIFDRQMTSTDLTPRQLVVMQAISTQDGASQTKLVELTGIDRSTLADIMRRMIRKGLVQRRRTKEDARAYAVSLTESGRRLMQKAKPIADRVDAKLLDALPASNRQRFLRNLQTIVGKLGSGEPGTGKGRV